MLKSNFAAKYRIEVGNNRNKGEGFLAKQTFVQILVKITVNFLENKNLPNSFEIQI